MNQNNMTKTTKHDVGQFFKRQFRFFRKRVSKRCLFCDAKTKLRINWTVENYVYQSSNRPPREFYICNPCFEKILRLLKANNFKIH